MEISSTVLEQALRGVNDLALPLAGAACVYLTICTRTGAEPAVPPATGRRARSPRLFRRAVSALGVAVTLSSPASAGGRAAPRRAGAGRSDVVDLRSGPGRFPPPRLPGPAEPPSGGAALSSGSEGTSVPPPWTSSGGRAGGVPWKKAGAGAHPALHGGVLETAGDGLFPRAKTGPAGPAGEPSPRGPSAGAASTRTASRRDAARDRRIGWHAVLPGDSLWSIAADRLRTDDIRRIARYWPRIHRANRDEIGPNPDLLRPGQVLELPPEHA